MSYGWIMLPDEGKRKLRLAWHLLLSRSYRQARSFGVYDSSYMRKITSFMKVNPVEPLETYMLKSGNDFLAEGALLKKGWIQFPDPHPLFDTAYYLCRYFPKGLRQNPYLHYLQRGWKQGLLPGPFVDEKLALVNDKSKISPFLNHAKKSPEKLFGGWFDIEYYNDTNPVIADAPRSEVVRYYKLYGSKEGKSPCLLFDPQYYLEQLTDEQQKRAQTDPLSHYICSLFLQKKNLTRPSPFFDPFSHFKRYNTPPKEDNIRRYFLGSDQNRYVGRNINRLKKFPAISILVPVYKPKRHYLNNCIRSVLYQSYPHWQLCLVDDGSCCPDLNEDLLAWSKKDSRIQVQFLRKNSGIANATNAAAQMANGEFLGFLDNDDELRLDCLEQMVAAQNESQADFVYSDEDLIGDNGTVLSLFRKPAYNPRLLLSHNYINHFVLIKRELFNRVGGFDPEFDGAQDYDLMLKLSEQTESISHVAQPLYHWRATESSTSINHEQKKYADKNGRNALEKAIQRRQITGKSVAGELNFFYRIAPLAQPAPCHIFIWQPKGHEFTEQTTKQLGNDTNIKLTVVRERNCSMAAAVTKAVKNVYPASDKYFIFISLPFLALSKNWLAALQTAFFDEKVAIVCGRRLFNSTDGPSYRLPDLSQHSTSYFTEFLTSHSLHANGIHCLQDLFCPGFGLVAIRTALFQLHQGFREKYPLLAMADLALRLFLSGYSAVYTPDAVINLPTKKEPVTDDNGEEKLQFQTEWHQQLHQYKRYYSPALLNDYGIEESAFSSWFCGRPANDEKK